MEPFPGELAAYKRACLLLQILSHLFLQRFLSTSSTISRLVLSAKQHLQHHTPLTSQQSPSISIIIIISRRNDGSGMD